MANASFADLTVHVNNGSDRDITSQVLEISDATVEALMEDGTPAGATWTVNKSVGVKQASDVTVTAFLDDTASTGFNAIFSAIGTTVTLTITYLSGIALTGSAIIKSYTPGGAKVKALTRSSAVLVWTGTVTVS